MFAKRRVNRKRGTRKPFRLRARRKAILAPVTVDPPQAKPTFDALGAPLYAWADVRPAPRAGAGPMFTASLKEKCAAIVASQPECLDPDYLEAYPWLCWRLVWLAALKMGTDLPRLFRMFADAFGGEPSYQCHWVVAEGHSSGTKDGARMAALRQCLVPVHKKHRAENVFSNVALHDFKAFVAGVRHASLVLDCSRMPCYSNEKLLLLATCLGLRGLDLSGNRNIDDQFLYTVAAHLRQNGGLVALRLCNCPLVTERGLRDLMGPGGPQCLMYIESDLLLPVSLTFTEAFLDSPNPAVPAPVKGTCWKLLSDRDPHLGKVYKYPMAMKLHWLLRNLQPVAEPGLLWDFKFFPETVEASNRAELTASAWNTRQLSHRPLASPYMYLRDPDMKTPPPSSETTKPKVLQPRPAEPAPKRARKPKVFATSAHAFFMESK